jgi:hypothetical protein
MKTLRLDLSKANRPGTAAGMVALLVAVGALLAAIRYLDHLKSVGETLDARESAIAREEQKYQAISKAHQRADKPGADQLMAQQRYAAEPARDLLERGWNPNIALLSVEVLTPSRQINVMFETRSVQDALSYADWIEAQPGTEHVSVMRQVQKPGPPAKSVETTLQITWRAAPGSAAPAASATALQAASAAQEAPR